MLSLLTGSTFSAAELGRDLDISQAAASYHLRKLHGAGVVRLVEVRAKRGGRERVYAYSPAPGPGSPENPSFDLDGHELFADAIAAELRRRVREAQPGAAQLGVDAELWVEPSEWQAAVDQVRSASVQLHKAARPPRALGTIRVSMSAALFEMTEQPQPDSE